MKMKTENTFWKEMLKYQRKYKKGQVRVLF